MKSRGRFTLATLAAVFLIAGARPARADLLDVVAQIRWHDLSPDQKERAKKNYRKYQNLSPEERGRVDDGYKRWKGMSDDDKRRVRDRYERKRKDRDD